MEMPHVKPRAPTALAIEASATSPKKRKFSINNNNKSSFVQLKSFSNATASATEERISVESPASCCSSNGSSGENRITKFSDLEVDQVETSTCNCGEQRIRREIMSLSSELRLTNNNNNNNSSQEVDSAEQTKTKSRRVLSPPQKMPSESELEEFFAAAEKDIQKRFTEKYNYDIVKDVPLEGRYEWVKLKP